MTDTPTIVYTHTDEAPALATYAFLPVIRAFAGARFGPDNRAVLAYEPADGPADG